MTRRMQAIRIQNGGRMPHDETVVREETVCLYLNGDLLVRLLASPSHLEDLATGFLVSEGLVSSVGDILSIEAGSTPTTVFIRTAGAAPDRALPAGAIRTSGCGAGITLDSARGRIKRVEGNLTVRAEEVLSLAREFEAASRLFRLTGGVHACALAHGGRLSLLREDIGRHNALDKVLGAALREKLDLSQSIVLVSGRISSEMVLKTARSRVGVIASRTAPTSTALDLASETGVCVVGFVRGGRMNVYTFADRITS